MQRPENTTPCPFMGDALFFLGVEAEGPRSVRKGGRRAACRRMHHRQAHPQAHGDLEPLHPWVTGFAPPLQLFVRLRSPGIGRL